MYVIEGKQTKARIPRIYGEMTPMQSGASTTWINDYYLEVSLKYDFESETLNLIQTAFQKFYLWSKIHPYPTRFILGDSDRFSFWFLQQKNEGDVTVIDVRSVAADFHARYKAQERT